MDVELVPSRTVLINVDLQNHFVDRAPGGPVVLDRINRLAERCRSAGVLVIQTVHVLRPDGSETGILGEMVPAVRERGVLNAGSRTAALHDGLVVMPEDLTLHKPRFGAFYGTVLEHILRARNIETLLIAGISTPVCCDTTAREANARDFRVLFLSDATASTGENDEEAAKWQQATLDVIDGLFGYVLSTDEVLTLLG